MVAYQGNSLGNHPTSAIPAQTGDSPSSRAIAPEGSSPAGAGMAWVDEPPMCAATMAKSGWPCEQTPTAHGRFCWGHRNLED